jgi:hypothetical protein
MDESEDDSEDNIDDEDNVDDQEWSSDDSEEMYLSQLMLDRNVSNTDDA